MQVIKVSFYNQINFCFFKIFGYSYRIFISINSKMRKERKTTGFTTSRAFDCLL